MITKSNIAKIKELDLGINLENRTIYLEQEINMASVSFFDQRIYYILNESKNFKDPITLKITSNGGDVYGMFGIVDIIKNAPVKINTFGIGAVFSAAAFVLIAGTGTKTVTKNTILMIHMMSTWFGGTTSDVLTEASHIKDLQNKLYKLLEENSSKSAKFWEKNSKVNLYLPAEKCLEYNLITNII